MERFLSPGSHCKDPVETPPPKAKAKGKPKGRPVGRPKAKAVEGALDLGEKRPRACRSKQVVIDEQRIKELERQIELLKTLRSEAGTPDERMKRVLRLHEQSEEENKQLRELLRETRGTPLQTPDRRPSGGCPSPEGDEFGNCEAVGKHFGHPRRQPRQL